MAQCTVTSGEIKASAQATFSRKIEGDFCMSSEFIYLLRNSVNLLKEYYFVEDMIRLKEDLLVLEARLMNEMHHLKSMIQNAFSRNTQSSYMMEQNRQNHYDVHQRANYYENSAPLQPNHNSFPLKTYQDDRGNQRFTTYPITTSTTPIPTTTTTTTTTTLRTSTIENQIQLKSLDTPRMRGKVRTETSTVAPKNEYSFYWKLVNFPKAFMHAKKNEIFSDTFKIKGLTLRIRANLNFEDDENFTLDTEQLADVQNADNIEISMGDGQDGLIFKEIVDEKLFQFSFEIIDQVHHPKHGLISPVYWNTDNDGFLIQNSIQMLSNYLKNDSLLIKLTISF